jgi:NAD(P)H-dependent flavin oxidoreductase YrpB (nitropropane dioxygenase family)
MLGFDEDESEASIAEQAGLLGDRAFGIGMAAWVLAARPALLDLAIALRPKLVSISFGDPKPYVQRLHESGILVASQVQSRQWAERALDAGVDILVAQGSEAGGHTGRVGTMVLMQIVLEMTDRPVLVADEFAGRALRNPFVDRWNGREEELMSTPAAIDEFVEAKARGDYTRAHVYAGESVGLVDRVEGAGDILCRLEKDAGRILETVVSRILT